MLIGLSGKKQTGKDTVCKIIKGITAYYIQSFTNENELCKFVIDYLNKSDLVIASRWETHSFAKKLRDCIYTITGDSRIYCLEDSVKNELSTIKDNKGNYYTIRQLLQKFGTEVGRNISYNIWVDSLINDYLKAKSGSSRPYWIVTDVRFQNEAESIRENGGILIRLNRKTNLNDDHSSEIALDNYNKFDVIIDNNGTLEELILKIHEVMIKFNLI